MKMLRSKLPESGKSVVYEILRIAKEYKAVDLASAVPDFSMSNTLANLISKYIRQGKNQYALEEGIQELRQALSQRLEDSTGKKYDPDTEVTVTAGATEAIWAAISAVVHEDDEVMIFEPAEDNYVPAVMMNGGTPIYITLKHPKYSIDWTEVNRSINQHTRMIIINNPHNPSGMMLSEDDLMKLQKIVAGNKIVVLSEETFSNIIYEKPHYSVARFPILSKQSVIVGSLGKGLNATGWKTGYVLAPVDYMGEIRKMHNFICNGSNTPFQYAAADYFRKKNEPEILQIREFYRQKRDFMCSLFKGSKYKILPTESTYFQTIDCSAVSPENDKDFAMRLVKDFGVAVIPMSTYYHDRGKSNIIRVCFARDNDLIEKGVNALLEVEKA
mgnify:FL=1